MNQWVWLKMAAYCFLSEYAAWIRQKIRGCSFVLMGFWELLLVSLRVKAKVKVRMNSWFTNKINPPLICSSGNIWSYQWTLSLLPAFLEGSNSGFIGWGIDRDVTSVP